MAKRKTVAVVADSHYDESSRFEECVRVHNWIADDLERRGVDLVLHAGDVYERRSSPRERLEAARWFQRVAELAPVVVARGNHDALGDLPLLERLKTKHTIDVYEGAGVASWGGCAIGVLAWPQRARLHTLVEGWGGREAVEQVGADALRNVLRGLGAELGRFADGIPRILLAHAMVRASRVSTGQPLVGCDFELGLDDLGLAHAGFYALGHVHLGQDWEIAGAPCVYPGSPRRTAFGEVETKGYLYAVFEGGACTDWQRVETPAAPMVLLGAVWEGPDRAFCRDIPTGDFERGAEIRLRYECAPDAREPARSAADKVKATLLARGAIRVQVEEIVRTTTRARAPEVAAARSTWDKLEALWRARNDVPSADRKLRLLSKLEQIETEVRHHAT